MKCEMGLWSFDLIPENNLEREILQLWIGNIYNEKKPINPANFHIDCVGSENDEITCVPFITDDLTIFNKFEKKYDDEQDKNNKLK